MVKGNEMIQRGQFTHEMRVAASLLALPKNERPLMKDIALEANVSERQLRNWKKEERFLQLVDQNVRNNVRGRIPDVLETVLQRAEEGSAKHAELVFKYQGMLTERHQHEVMQDVPHRHDISKFDRNNEDLARELADLKDLIEESKREEVIDVDFKEVDEK